MHPLLLLLAAFLVAVPALSYPLPLEWHTLEWDSVTFTHFEGDILIPDIPSSNNHGIIHIWPGLQGDSGVLQSVLSLRFGKSSIGNGFFAGDLHPLGNRLTDVKPGDSFHFSFSRMGTSGTWTCTLTGPGSTSTTFPVTDSPMTRAIFAISITGAKHDFSVSYNNVVITADNAPAIKWCSKTGSRGYDSVQYTINNPIADGNTCRISSIHLPSTA